MIKKLKKNQKGFTLVELMVVVVIIGILVAIAIPVYRGVQDSAKENAEKANIKIIENAIEIYLTDDGSLNNLSTEEGLKNALVPKYLKEIPESPYGGTYTVEVKGDNFKVIGPGDTESGENAGDTESGGNG